jgi:methyl-accepting chemotaxis protein
VSSERASHEDPASSRRLRVAADPRILAGLGLLVALLAGAVGGAVYLIAALERDTRELSDRPFQYATAIHDAALHAKAVANHERGFLISGGEEEFARESELETADAREAFAAAERYAANGRERDAAVEARNGFERWLKSSERDIAAFRAGSEEQAIDSSLTTTRQLRKAYERSLERAHQFGLQSIDTARNSLSDSASRSVNLLLVYLAVALVVGIAVAIWVARAILRPTQALTRNALAVLTQGRVLVKEGEGGSHYAVAVEVPVEVVNTLAESALETQDVFRGGRGATKPIRTDS